jgi:hypothetical protein
MLGLSEIVVRSLTPNATFGASKPPIQLGGAGSGPETFFTTSSEMGFRPVLGEGFYDEYGTLRNDYDVNDRGDRTRLLFIGDSVTARGLIVLGLQWRDGSKAFEFWNAGVESFNTAQEVAYYKRYNAGIKPDHVILSFHLNDFETTPVVLRDANGRLVLYALEQPATPVNRFLFAESYLYRALLGLVLAPGGDPNAIAAEVEANLAELKGLLERDGIDLSVIIVPFMASPDQWQSGQRERHATILEVLDRLGIRHFDLLPALEEALVAGVVVQQEPGDIWHPSWDAAQAFTTALLNQGLLAPTP